MQHYFLIPLLLLICQTSWTQTETDVLVARNARMIKKENPQKDGTVYLVSNYYDSKVYVNVHLMNRRKEGVVVDLNCSAFEVELHAKIGNQIKERKKTRRSIHCDIGCHWEIMLPSQSYFSKKVELENIAGNYKAKLYFTIIADGEKIESNSFEAYIDTLLFESYYERKLARLESILAKKDLWNEQRANTECLKADILFRLGDRKKAYALLEKINKETPNCYRVNIFYGRWMLDDIKTDTTITAENKIKQYHSILQEWNKIPIENIEYKRTIKAQEKIKEEIAKIQLRE